MGVAATGSGSDVYASYDAYAYVGECHAGGVPGSNLISIDAESTSIYSDSSGDESPEASQGLLDGKEPQPLPPKVELPSSQPAVKALITAASPSVSRFSSFEKGLQTALKVMTCIPVIGLIGMVIMCEEIDQMSFSKSIEVLELQRDYLLCMGFQMVTLMVISIALIVLGAVPLITSLAVFSLALVVIVFILFDTLEDIEKQQNLQRLLD